MKERLYLFDTTLRDGQQTAGVDFALEEKLSIARLLDEIGVDYIEGGYPGANPTDTALFSEKRGFTNARFTAFGMTKRPGRSASNDPGLQTSLAAMADALCFVGKTWDYHVDVALGTTPEENLISIRETIKAGVASGRETMIDCEHFFDGYKANPAYALACARLPHEISKIVTEVAKHIPGERLGIHPHDDSGCAVANAFAAVDAGVRQIQGTLNGLGERCGNANLVSIIPTLKLKPEFRDRFEIGVTDEGLKGLTHLSRLLDEMLNRNPNRYAPYVGANAFATKAGIHASAILKDPRTYEHVPPEAVGNKRRLMVSDQGGKSNLLAELERIGLNVGKDDPKLSRLLDEVKDRENAGYAYEGAEASFELLARRVLGTVPDYFEVDSFRTSVERRHNALGELVTVCEAVVKVTVSGDSRMSVAEGNGPVNALDVALRKDLGIYQPFIADLRLTDYKVRILDGGTEAVTRVMIESADDTGDVWTTVGVSPNIIDASFQALVDSITYKLVKSGAPAP
jgi:2-isopropylmalate synthase